jgi:antitoxin HicB
VERTYTVVLLHERDGRYSAVVPALDCASWGHTVPEALRMVEEALSCHLGSLEAHGDPIPPDPESFTVVMGDALDALVYRVTVPRQEEAQVA